MLVSSAMGKSGPTFYTPERVAAAKHNLATYEWAQQLFKRMMAGDRNDYYIGRTYGSAADCIAQTDDFIWLMQPTSLLPRRIPNHSTRAMCPIHGEEVRTKSAWTAWTTDPIHHPYQVRCRLGGEWYPSNDYMNGDMTSGDFPDDGTGCQVGDKRFYFLMEYAHMAYANNTVPCLKSLAEAWKLTDDTRYARKGCILLARLASEYPNFTDRKDRLFFGPYGGRDPHYSWKTGGIMTDLIWETFCLETTAYAYDGLWDYMDKDPEMISFLQGKGMEIKDGNDLRKYIEDRLLRVGMEGILNGSVHGNLGHHQAAAMACALILDDYDDEQTPNSKQLVDYAFLGEGASAYVIQNGLLRDGGGHESPGYATIKFDFIRVNQLMEEVRQLQPEMFPIERYPDIFGNDKGRAIFDFNIDQIIFHMYLPSIGDTGGIQEVRRLKPSNYALTRQPNVYGFGRFADPRFARASTTLDGELSPGEMFEPYPEGFKEALEQPESQILFRDRLLDDYGCAIFEAGHEPMSGRALALNYSSLLGHRQGDNLNFEIFARGLNLLPDLGYPYTWDYREWDSWIMSHNTVSVDETPSATSRGGQCNLFAQREGIHVVSARHDPYPPHLETGGTTDPPPAQGVDIYERTCVMVEVGDDQFYVVDLFSVNGGSQHDQSWHGPLVPMQAPDLGWQEQPQGTLAGPEVPHATQYTDRWGRQTRNFPCFITKVRRATLSEAGMWSWDYGLPEGDKLHMHVLPVGGPAEVIMGSGRSPARPADWGLDYLLVRKASQGDQPNLFVTVFDAYQGTPVVAAARVVSTDPLTVEVQRTSGGVDSLVFAVPQTTSRTSDHRPLGIKFVSIGADQPRKEVQFGTWAPDEGPGYASGKLVDVNYETREVVIEAAADDLEHFTVDSYVRIFNSQRSGMFRLLEVTPEENQRLRLRLDVTAHLAEGPVAAVEDDKLTLNSWLLFANGRYDEKGEALVTADYFAGSWLGEGEAARQVKGVMGVNNSKVYWAEPLPQAEGEELYGGKVVTLWAYGVGDQIEIAKISSQ